jgi:hypothetical protein
VGVIAIGVLAFGVVAYGGQYDQLAADVQATLTKGKVIEVLPPLPDVDIVVPSQFAHVLDNMRDAPRGVPMPVIGIYNDGWEGVASGVDWAPMTAVYHNPVSNWSGSYWPVLDNLGANNAGLQANTSFGAGWGAAPFNPLPLPYWDAKWAKVQHEFYASYHEFGAGFQPGMQVVGYDIRGLGSSFGSVTFDLQVSMWDGDPLGVVDTVCADPTLGPQPIPGATLNWTDYPRGHTVLLGRFKEKVTVNCDHVWLMVEVLEGCRWGRYVSAGYSAPYVFAPEVGYGNGMEYLHDCGSYGHCLVGDGGQPNGTCCQDGTACDHSDGTDECITGDSCYGEQATFIHAYTYAQYPGYYIHTIDTIWAQASIVLDLMPVEAHPKPGDITGASVGEIEGNEITLAKGGVNVWLEIRAGDFDPDDTGIQVSAWQVTVDTAGFTSGLEYRFIPRLLARLWSRLYD